MFHARMANRALCCIVLGIFLSACNVESKNSDNSTTGITPKSTASATLSWHAPEYNEDSTTLNDLAGYKLYYGTASGSYTETIDFGNAATANVSGLAKGQTYFFAVAAYDQNGNESALSSEVSKSF